MKLVSGALAVCVLASTLGGARPAAAADEDGLLPTGFRITPTAAPGSTFVRLATGLRADGNADAAEASAVALSPDGATLLVLTSGYNLKFQTEAGVDITHPPIDPATGRFSSRASLAALTDSTETNCSNCSTSVSSSGNST